MEETKELCTVASSSSSTIPEPTGKKKQPHSSSVQNTVRSTVQQVAHGLNPKSTVEWDMKQRSTRTEHIAHMPCTTWTFKAAEQLLGRLTKAGVIVNDIRWNVADGERFALVVDVLDSERVAHELETALEERTVLQATAMRCDDIKEAVSAEDRLLSMRSEVAKEDRATVASISILCRRMQGSETPVGVTTHVRLQQDGNYAIEISGLGHICLRHLRLLAQVDPMHVIDVLLNAEPSTQVLRGGASTTTSSSEVTDSKRSSPSSKLATRVVLLCASVTKPLRQLWTVSGVQHMPLHLLDGHRVQLRRRAWAETDVDTSVLD